MSTQSRSGQDELRFTVTITKRAGLRIDFTDDALEEIARDIGRRIQGADVEAMEGPIRRLVVRGRARRERQAYG